VPFFASKCKVLHSGMPCITGHDVPRDRWKERHRGFLLEQWRDSPGFLREDRWVISTTCILKRSCRLKRATPTSVRFAKLLASLAGDDDLERQSQRDANNFIGEPGNVTTNVFFFLCKNAPYGLGVIKNRLSSFVYHCKLCWIEVRLAKVPRFFLASTLS
jgi:hypothetical protein